MTPNPEQAHASLSTTGTASSLVALGYTAHEDTESVLIQVVGGDARMTLNGTDPTASLGLKIGDGEMIQLSQPEFLVAKFITGSGSPKLEIVGYLNS